MSRKLTTEEFIAKAREVHGDKYDYSKTDYIYNRIKVRIKCRECGKYFWQTPNSHLSGHGCPYHGGVKFNKNIFIEKSKKTHGNKYDYSKVNYINNNTKVCIICPKHGEFWQTPSAHMNGEGCKKCRNDKLTSDRSFSNEQFIKQAIGVHGNIYDYSKIIYKNARTKVEIICPKHGSFFQTPDNHLRGKNGCPLCKWERLSKHQSFSNDEFINRARDVHGDKFDYSKVKYINANTKVCIICPIHGEFWITPGNHINSKNGCKKCGNDSVSKKKLMSTDYFVERAKNIHGDKYDYSFVSGVNRSADKVKIKCNKCGKIFYSTRSNILAGHGCPNCRNSQGELKINDYLKQNNIEYKAQYPIKLEQQMFSRNNLRIDFYLPKYNTFIEFNGEQHYKYISYFHKTEEDFNKQVERDKRLKQYCKDNKIKLIVIKYNQIDKIEDILNKKLKI